jgi:hypothetical protein
VAQNAALKKNAELQTPPKDNADAKQKNQSKP